jgi:hypothetical protein
MIPHYHINIFWHDPDQCWIADIPDLEEWIASAEKHGDPVPAPRYRPAIYAVRQAA